MITINRNNFKDNVEKIFDNIKKADFIAIDTEFTGLCAVGKNKICYWDDQNQYYMKCRKNTRNLSILQFGLTTTTFDSKFKMYHTTSYTFNLFPSCYLNNQPSFSIQTEAIQFLKDSNFDFNQCFLHGIPYMTMENYLLYKGLLDLYQKYPKAICSIFSTLKLKIAYKSIKNDINLWFSKNTNTSLTINPQYKDEFFITGLLINIVEDFDAKIYPQYDGIQIFCKKSENSSENVRDKLNQTLQNLLYDAFGFGQIISFLIKNKKTLVGHNMILDLMFIHEKFVSSLPETLLEFKSFFKEIFFAIYDTKYMVKKVIESYNYFGKGSKTSLSNLYDILKKKNNDSELKFPSITFFVGDSQFHDAGFDSYAASFVFIHLTHIISHENAQILGDKLYFETYMSFIKKYSNYLNIPSIYMNLLVLDKEIKKDIKLERKFFNLPSCSVFEKLLIENIIDHFKGRSTRVNENFILEGNAENFKSLQFNLKAFKIKMKPYSNIRAAIEKKKLIRNSATITIFVTIGVAILSFFVWKIY